MREIVLLECTVCHRRNYSTTTNKGTNREKLQIKKYCKYCKKHTLHKEVKA